MTPPLLTKNIDLKLGAHRRIQTQLAMRAIAIESVQVEILVFFS